MPPMELVVDTKHKCRQLLAKVTARQPLVLGVVALFLVCFLTPIGAHCQVFLRRNAIRVRADYRLVRKNRRACKADKLLMRSRMSMCDPDHDHLPSVREYRRYKTNYRKRDSDGDGLDDNLEIARYGTKPRKFNTDGDGCSDGQEVLVTGTNPLLADCILDPENMPIPDPSNTPVPEPTPYVPPATPTPYAPPTPCAGGNFDGQGDTSAFGIPAPLIGNIMSGQVFYSQTCGAGGCHGNTVRNPGIQFADLKGKVTSPPMSLPGITDQSFAHLVAYLNQANVGDCGMGTPTPTPTPNPVQYGAQIFTSSCALGGCHSLNSNGRPNRMDRHPSRNSIHEALWTGPDEMPQFRHFTIGREAPPYTVQEDALYQYLQSLP